MDETKPMSVGASPIRSVRRAGRRAALGAFPGILTLGLLTFGILPLANGAEAEVVSSTTLPAAAVDGATTGSWSGQVVNTDDVAGLYRSGVLGSTIAPATVPGAEATPPTQPLPTASGAGGAAATASSAPAKRRTTPVRSTRPAAVTAATLAPAVTAAPKPTSGNPAPEKTPEKTTPASSKPEKATPTTPAKSLPDTTTAAPKPTPAPAAKAVSTTQVPAAKRASTRDDASDDVPASVWAQLRHCESGGNYAINTGNGYYGAYQISAATWRRVGFEGLPHQAPPAVQDEAARKILAIGGWGQWPACSRKLGLR